MKVCGPLDEEMSARPEPLTDRELAAVLSAYGQHVPPMVAVRRFRGWIDEGLRDAQRFLSDR